MRQRLIRWLMKLFENSLPPDNYCLSEVFDHPAYVHGTAEERREIQRRSSQAKYDDEQRFRWDAYFGTDLEPLLRGKVALDLGSFTGGRTVAWAEHYRFERVYGADVRWDFAQAGRRFAAAHNVAGRFVPAVGERLPFREGRFDAVLSFDVFEHTRDPERVLAECRRVLRRGGRLFVVFPGYYHPIEHHLSCVTRTPFLHYFFSGSELVRACHTILAERSEAAAWYARRQPELAPWERCHTINGTTMRGFRGMIRRTNWVVERRSVLPLLRVGRRSARHPLLRALSSVFAPFAHLPVLEEVFCHRIVYILRKP